MPSKKKKYNARFPAGRIKKIMQTDEEVGKVAQAVPIIISRTLELFVESLLTKSMQITQSRNAKTLTPSHMKQCILSEKRFDFLKDLVKDVPDASVQEDNENDALYEENGSTTSENATTTTVVPPSLVQSSSRTPVIQHTSKTPTTPPTTQRLNFSINSIMQPDPPPTAPKDPQYISKIPDGVPPLLPVPHNYTQNFEDNLCIDEDYDN